MTHRPVHHLEELLSNWEDWCFMQHTAISHHLACGSRPPAQIIGGYKNWSRLRSDILGRKMFVWPDYYLPDVALQNKQLFDLVPFCVWAWSYWSRRTYSLSRDLQALLLATTTRGITYADVVLPFNAFVIELPRPILDENGKEHDAILVASGSSDTPTEPGRPEVLKAGQMLMTPLRKNAGQYALPDFFRDKLKKFVAHRRWDKVGKLHGELATDFDSVPVGGLIIDRREQGHLPVVTPIDKIFAECSCGQKHEKHPEMHEQMVRLVVGFCLYLKTLPSGSPQTSAWSPLSKNARFYASAVTNGANICEVGHELKLDPADLAILESRFIGDEHTADDGGHKIEIKAHFRSGHWRRWPGTGHNPNAPKIIHIHPTFVRRDKFAEGFVPEAVRVKIA